MERRTLLKSALALPLADSLRSGAVSGGSAAGTRDSILFSGLAGLDYSMGGIGAGEMICVVGPTHMGKSLLLLELAARMSSRYGENVLFYSAHQPSVYLARKAALRGAHVIFAGEFLEGEAGFGAATDPAIHLLDSSRADVGQACAIAGRLRGEHSAGCAVLILDGFGSLPARFEGVEVVEEVPTYPAQRWPHALMSEEVLGEARRFGESSGIPVVVGITTASLMDDAALAYSCARESAIRHRADRWLVLHRPELYRGTAERRDAERNLVRLTGTSPSWWDTRCSGLRFDPKRVGFSTAA